MQHLPVLTELQLNYEMFLTDSMTFASQLMGAKHVTGISLVPKDLALSVNTQWWAISALSALKTLRRLTFPGTSTPHERKLLASMRTNGFNHLESIRMIDQIAHTVTTSARDETLTTEFGDPVDTYDE